jgi:hypothetical protein
MPAILRKSLPNLFASLCNIRPYAQHGVVVGSRPPWIKVLAACGSATLCLGVGGSPTTFFGVCS